MCAGPWSLCQGASWGAAKATSQGQRLLLVFWEQREQWGEWEWRGTRGGGKPHRSVTTQILQRVFYIYRLYSQIKNSILPAVVIWRYSRFTLFHHQSVPLDLSHRDADTDSVNTMVVHEDEGEVGDGEQAGGYGDQTMLVQRVSHLYT